MELPTKLSERMKGQRLAVTNQLIATSGNISILGTKTLVITDRPAIYLHDTGGLFGSEQVFALESLSTKANLAFAKSGKVLRGAVEFKKGAAVTFELNGKATRIVDALPAHSSKNGDGVLFRSPLPVSVKCHFTHSREQIQQYVIKYEPDLEDAIESNWSELLNAEYRDKKPALLALVEHLQEAEFQADVVVQGNRLQLVKNKQKLADIPLDHLVIAEPSKQVVTLGGEAIVAELAAESIAIALPSKAMANRLHEAISQQRADKNLPTVLPARGLVEVVQINGQLGGEPIDARMDAILTDDALELRSTDDVRTAFRFSFSDPAVSMAGTSERFIIADNAANLVAVSAGADRFRQRLIETDAVRTAAQRTLASGPYPLFVENAPVLCRAGDGGLELTSAAENRCITYGDIRNLRRQSKNGKEAVCMTTGPDESPIAFVAGRDVLQAFATAVRTEFVVRQFTDRSQELMGTLLGLERDYFICSLFGPLYDVHAILAQQSKKSAPHEALPIPDSLEQCLALAGVMAQGIEPIRSHLDKACYYFPSQLVNFDSELCRAAGLPTPTWIKTQERSYRGVLTGLAPVVAEVRMIRETLLRISGLQPAMAHKPDYSATAISLAAAAFINPIFAIGGAQQAYAAYKTGKQVADQSDNARQSAERVIGQWNYLLTEFLPALLHYVLDGLFPLRMQFYERIRKQLEGGTAKEQNTLTRQLARRLATLHTFLQYPANEATKHSRGEMAAVVKQIRNKLQYDGFQAF